jgi:hypothetical protein
MAFQRQPPLPRSQRILPIGRASQNLESFSDYYSSI